MYVLKDYGHKYANDAEVHVLAEKMQNRKLQESSQSGMHFGFVKVNNYGGVCVYGAFTQEYLKEGIEYDPITKKEIPVKQFFCEDRWFLFEVKRGIVLLESTYFSNIPGLDFTLTKKRFFEFLKDASVSALSRGTKPKEYERVITLEEMRKYYKGSHRVKTIEVDRLLHQKIPSSIRLSNPDYKKDELLRASFEEDFNHIDKIVVHAGSKEGDLKKTKIGEATTGVGELNKLVEEKEDGKEQVRKRIIKSEFEVSIETDELNEEVVEIILRKLEAPEYAIQVIKDWVALQKDDDVEETDESSTIDMF